MLTLTLNLERCQEIVTKDFKGQLKHLAPVWHGWQIESEQWIWSHCQPVSFWGARLKIDCFSRDSLQVHNTELPMIDFIVVFRYGGRQCYGLCGNRSRMPACQTCYRPISTGTDINIASVQPVLVIIILTPFDIILLVSEHKQCVSELLAHRGVIFATVRRKVC